jgi:putative hemolysin
MNKLPIFALAFTFSFALLLTGCEKSDSGTPEPENIFIMEEALDYCVKKGGRIEMVMTPDGSVQQICAVTNEEGKDIKCDIFEFYEEICGHDKEAQIEVQE